MVQVVDETDQDLRALIARDFGSIPPATDFSVIVLDWMHYRARLIPRRPRKVLLSPEVTAHSVRYPAINRIKKELESGGDLAPWLSDQIRKRKADPKADLMFNDWQISHFHLGNVFVNPTKVSRTENGKLLFAHISPERAVLLDVKQHGAWAMRDLLRVLLRVSPKDMRELKGVLGTQNGDYTDEEIIAARNSGISLMYKLEGRFFMSPGLGVSSSQHGTRLVLAYNRLRREIANVRLDLAANKISAAVRRLLASALGQPVRLGVKIEAGQLVIYDKNRNLLLSVAAALH